MLRTLSVSVPLPRSFGVLLWEMWTGQRAWAGLTFPRILQAVAFEGKSPCFPDAAPVEYAVRLGGLVCAAVHKAPALEDCCLLR